MTPAAPLKIVLLEDSESDVILIQRQFVKQGVACQWILAETPEQFLQALAQPADAIISDMLIPGFGAEAALKILSAQAGPQPPLVVISGLIGEEVAVEMMKAGAKDFVVKSNLKRVVPVVLRSIREARLERIEEQSRRQAERAIRDRERLLEIVSHDLKNPLGAMTLNLQLLEQNLAVGAGAELRVPGGDRNHVLIERLRKSVVRVDRLIRDVLDQAKIEAGKFVISPHRTSVRELFEDLQDVFLPLAEARDVRLHFESALHQDHQVFDGERIHQVLSNLVANAIKFTAIGSDVQVNVVPTPHGLRFSVKDEGPGIPENEREMVFTKFWQAPDRQKFGTGLGLSIAREIVRGHHGEIGVMPASGRGSEFWFEIPYLQEEVSSPSEVQAHVDERLTILLLEDDEDLREVMEETLRNSQTDVISMAFGAQAMETLQQGLRPQVLIVDHDLPGMTGGEFLRRAFTQGLIPPNARVVLTSAHPDLKDRAASLGVSMTLQKPFTLRRLVDQVDQWRQAQPTPLRILGAPEVGAAGTA